MSKRRAWEAATIGAILAGTFASVAAQAPCQFEWSDAFDLPGVSGTVSATAIYNDGTGPALYVGGSFYYRVSGEIIVGNVAKWSGSAWSALPGTAFPGLGGPVAAMTVFDDGTGPALYVAGTFTSAGGVAAKNIAKWNGSTWAPLGGGVEDSPKAMAVFDDGLGPALYVGGTFTLAGGVPANRIAKWDGHAWSSLGTGVNSGAGNAARVNALAVFDLDGSGPIRPALYVCGKFSSAGNVQASGIARWDGTSWSALPGDPGVFDNEVLSMVVFDEDGQGPNPPALIVAAGDGFANYVSKWYRAGWEDLPPGQSHEFDYRVSCLAVFDDGHGPALYAGGQFTTVGGSLTVNHIAKWNGSAWSKLEAGLTFGSDSGAVNTMIAFDRDGPGPQPASLYAGGDFDRAGEVTLGYTGNGGVASWDGSTWSALGWGLQGDGTGTVISSLAQFDDGSGPALFAGGSIQLQPGTPNNIAKWSGRSWLPLGSGTSDRVVALLAFDDDGPGPHPQALYAGGTFTSAGGVANTNHIARWNGSAWSAVGTGIADSVFCLVAFDEDGAGPNPARLFAGTGTVAGPGSRVLRWDGTSWTFVGDAFNSYLSVLAVFDEDGPGPAAPSLFAGGFFTVVGTPPPSLNHIARWNGTSWVGVGGGVDSGVGDSYVTSMAALDPDGPGPAATKLYVGGIFASASGGTVPANEIAAWDGSAWSALGNGLSGAGYWGVRALTTFDDGTGQALFAGGDFTCPGDASSGCIGGITTNAVAKWNGSSWSALGSGLDNVVRALVQFNDGQGIALYAGGGFMHAGGKPSYGIAKWSKADPTLLTQPVDRIGCIGSPVTFSVSASGSAPFAYQWHKGSTTLSDGANISGSATPTLTNNPMMASDVGEYYAVVSNACGAVTSGTASLSLPPITAITQQPTSQTVCGGSAVSLAVAAHGTGTLSYQWRKNQVNITDGGNVSGTSTPTLTLNPAATTDSGSYDVIVSNCHGSLGSEPATLVVQTTATSWAQITEIGPPARQQHATAYDSARGVTVLFGGNSGGGETWEWNGAAWKLRSTSGPSPRYGHAMAYDSARGVCVLFGGSTGGNETWEWNGTVWTGPYVGGPSSRTGHAMAYDSSSDRMVLFGGSSGGGETWEWNGATHRWTQQPPTGASPSARSGHAMAYDSVRRATVLFGGTTGGNETWEWKNSAWTLRSTTGPSPRSRHAMVYDGVRNRIVLFGGSNAGNETWEWNGTSSPPAWTVPPPSPPTNTPPAARNGHAMAYDIARNKTVLFGGAVGSSPTMDFFGDTWEWNNSTFTWVQRSAGAPAARYGHAMAYDSAMDLCVLFGGLYAVGNPPASPTYFRDTWTWSGLTRSWMRIELGGGSRPSARSGHAMAYDSTRGRTVLFGGLYDVQPFDDSWEWDGSHWSMLYITGDAPLARTGHAMAYDSARGEAILFGGFVNAAPTKETWALKWGGPFVSWVNKTPGDPANSPSERGQHSMAYDSARARVVLFGGGGSGPGGPSSNETWEWDGTSWSMRGSSGPPGLRSHTMVYDSAHKVVLLYGGVAWINGMQVDNRETWTWDGNTWSRVSDTGPSARNGHAMVYDSRHATSLLFGGRDTSYSINGESWELEHLGPSFTQNPLSQIRCVGDTVTLSVVAEGPVATYQWRKGMSYLNDVVGHLQGAATMSLQIISAEQGDSGVYDCVLINECGSLASAGAALTVRPPGSGDGDGSGTANGLDIQLFLETLSGVSPPTSLASCAFDMNHDGVVDMNDLPLFVERLLGLATFPCAQADGDINGDGAVDGRDISGFAQLVLAAGPTSGENCAADMDHDSFVGLGDLELFTARLLSGLVVYPCAQLKGDTNNNGLIEGNDVAGFIQLVLVGGQTSEGNCSADVNGDGEINTADVPAFVDALLLP